MIDAIRPTGWVTLNTQWQAIDRPSFVAWVRQFLAPRRCCAVRKLTRNAPYPQTR